jgi:hypothetical protein
MLIPDPIYHNPVAWGYQKIRYLFKPSAVVLVSISKQHASRATELDLFEFAEKILFS